MGFFGRLRSWMRRRRESGQVDERDALNTDAEQKPESGRTVVSLEVERYKAGNYLHFGLDGDAYPAGLDLEGATRALAMFASESYAPNLQGIGRNLPYQPAPLSPGVHVCDFCGHIMCGGEYDVLRDGRERCARCSRTVIKNASEIKRVFHEVKKRMELLYGIRFENEVGVQVVSARKLHKLGGRVFVPTSDYDVRWVGYETMKHGRQFVVLENGFPRISFISTIAHELTHCWQDQIPYFIELYNRVARGEISDETRLLVLEGHAIWSEIQYLFLIGETESAQDRMDCFLRRDDEYGHGFSLYLQQYGLSRTSLILRDTPFNHPDKPLSI